MKLWERLLCRSYYEEWSQWSDREIARQCQVSPKTVSKYRKKTGVEIPQVRKGKDGKTYDTSNIGNSKEGLAAVYLVSAVKG